MQTIRRSDNWPEILKILDEPGNTPMRIIAVRALADRFEPKVVDGLIKRLGSEKDAARRREYADLLTRVCKKPGQSVYWGYRPAPRPANTVTWEKTEAIAETLNGLLSDAERDLRLFVLRRIHREKVPVRLATLSGWLADEHQPDRVAALLISLGEQPAAEARRHLDAVVRDRRHSNPNRLAALTFITRGLDTASADPLLNLAEALEDGPVLAEALFRTGKYPKLPAAPLLLHKLNSPVAEVRAAAIEALGELRAPEGREPIVALLQDEEVRVRRAAAAAAGKLAARRASDSLLKLMSDADPAVRRASLESLRQLRELRVVPLAVAGLNERSLELVALQCLEELGGPEQAGAVAELARRNPSARVPAAAVRVLTVWRNREGLTAARRQELDRAVAEIHGANGILVRWQADGGPSPASIPAKLVEPFARIGSTPFHEERTLFATGTEGRVLLAPKSSPKDAWLAYTDVTVADSTPVEFQASSNGTLQVWLNGQSLHRREQAQSFRLDSDRFAGTLDKGVNRLLVQVGPSEGPVEFPLRFRRKSAKAEHERLTQAALSRPGNPQRGRQLFFDTDKSQCLKCHRLGDRGERFGPELTGVGSRFSRIYMVESILEPSRTIAPSFGTLVVSLKNGKELTGVKVAETETTLTLADNQGQKQMLAKADVEKERSSHVSTMPEGLEKRFTEDEFVDLIAFLASQKESRAMGPER